MDRRKFITTAAAGTAALVGLRPSVASALPGVGRLVNEGAGTYTDASVAGLPSFFTINPLMVSCGVGTVQGGPTGGPFAMFMFSTDIRSYRPDPRTGRITARGRMRSITRFGATTAEDVEHDFLAIAVDRNGAGSDRFDTHFTTPFWNPSNPFCTPSPVVPGWCRFGGDLMVDESGQQMGDVVVIGARRPT